MGQVHQGWTQEVSKEKRPGSVEQLLLSTGSHMATLQVSNYQYGTPCDILSHDCWIWGFMGQWGGTVKLMHKRAVVAHWILVPTVIPSVFIYLI